MARRDGIPSHYPCLMQKDGLRRVHEPADERPFVRASPLRRAVTRLVAAVRG